MAWLSGSLVPCLRVAEVLSKRWCVLKPEGGRGRFVIVRAVTVASRNTFFLSEHAKCSGWQLWLLAALRCTRWCVSQTWSFHTGEDGSPHSIHPLITSHHLRWTSPARAVCHHTVDHIRSPFFFPCLSFFPLLPIILWLLGGWCSIRDRR